MPKITIDRNKCKGCGLCIEYCPLKMIKMSEEINESGIHFAVFEDNGRCTACSICAWVCPDAAIEVYK